MTYHSHPRYEREKYVGKWKNGIKEGQGIMTWKNGDQF